MEPRRGIIGALIVLTVGIIIGHKATKKINPR